MNKKKRLNCVCVNIVLFILLISCNKIENTASLKKEDLDHLKSLKLLDNNEVVYKFYSQYKKDLAGNFFTNKKIASYWIDERNSEKNEKNLAYYNEIKKMDIVYNAGLTYTPFILVTKKNGKSFKVSVDGEKNDIKFFFEDVLKEWKKHNFK